MAGLLRPDELENIPIPQDGDITEDELKIYREMGRLYQRGKWARRVVLNGLIALGIVGTALAFLKDHILALIQVRPHP